MTIKLTNIAEEEAEEHEMPDKPSIVIGSDVQCDFIINGVRISGNHC